MQSHRAIEDGISRKQFLVLTAASIAAASCESLNSAGNGATAGRTVDAGPSGRYSADGVDASFREQGFFLVRRAGKLTAISSYCTHRHCKLEAEPDRSFYCPCHGSTFDPGGKVTTGPATRNLPECPLTIDAGGHVLVTVVG
jgi:Rieske Fe-S protein